MLAVEFLLCLHMRSLRLAEVLDSSDPVSTSASVASLAGCGWLEDAMPEPLPVEETEGGYTVSSADFPILWKSPVWSLQPLQSLHCNTVKYFYF